jgi:hypothetical protein
MCVLFCANSIVHEWIDIPLARAHRQSLELCALCPDDPYAGQMSQNGGVAQAAVKHLEKAAPPCVMKRSAWVQAYCSRMAHRQASAQDWHKTFDAIANAWGRLLTFVGLRW